MNSINIEYTKIRVIVLTKQIYHIFYFAKDHIVLIKNKKNCYYKNNNFSVVVCALFIEDSTTKSLINGNIY